MRKTAKACFIAPYGSNHSEGEKSAEGLVSIIEPLLEEFDVGPVTLHLISTPGQIRGEVIEDLRRDRLAVFDMSGQDPGVMYLLGIRHALMLPSMLIAEAGTRNPFDGFGLGMIPFNREGGRPDMAFETNFRKALPENLAPETLQGPPPLLGEGSGVRGPRDSNRAVLERLEAVEKTLGRLVEEVRTLPRVRGDDLRPAPPELYSETICGGDDPNRDPSPLTPDDLYSTTVIFDDEEDPP